MRSAPPRRLVVAVSGYNATGKSTLVEILADFLREQNVDVVTQRFDALYPSSQLSRRPPRKYQLDKDQSVDLRSIEGQPGRWNKPFRIKHLLNAWGAAIRLRGLRRRQPHQVLLLDRYFCDRYIHFDPQGWWYRLALRWTPQPDLHIVMIPERTAWEAKILERVHRRSGLELERLSDKDSADLDHVTQRYQQFAQADSRVHVVDRCQPQQVQAACEAVLELCHPRLSEARAT